MPYPADLAPQQLVTLPRASLAALRAALLRDHGGAYAAYLQEAGYAGGETVYAAFREWLTGRGAADAPSLPLAAFATQAGAFFADAGWGTITVESLHEVVAAIDAHDWAEADATGQLGHAGCQFTSGLFADFFGRIGSGTLAVMEVECRSAGAARCRFLVGSPEVLQQVYQRMTEGVGYLAAIEELA